MLRCIELAKNGLGSTYPNPMVGSVIVHDNRIIGEGWHRKAGEPHAEVNAINSVLDKSLLPNSTLYVNLEPCSHFGKTPPCSDLIIEHKIKKVFIGSTDPNPKVSGRGIQKLKDAGCEVQQDILKQECDELNKRFFTFFNKQRPYIILKWAQTEDGFIAPRHREIRNKPVWITNNYSQQRSHKLRAEEQAILVGTNTVFEDDPSLTTRTWKGDSPQRFVIDRLLKIPTTAKIRSEEAGTYIFTESKSESKQTHYIPIDFNKPLGLQICQELYRLGIQSLIVEGGTRTLQTFINENLWDEAMVFTGPTTFKDGVSAPVFQATKISEENIKNDMLRIYKNPNP